MRTWIVLVAACGRIDFADVPDGSFVVGDVSTDVPDVPDGSCPAGFVEVNGNSMLGTTDFCVMRTEARAWLDTNGDSRVDDSELDLDGCETLQCDSDWSATPHRPVSVLPVPVEPWRSVSAVRAREACASLGAGFDLMSNREWMTIARTAEQDPRNWFGGIVGNVRIVQGQIDNAGVSAIADPTDGYTGTGNDENEAPGAGWEERRTLHVGEKILWDLPGNYQEWVDWTLGAPLDGAPTPCSNAELPAFACVGIVAEDFQSSTGTYDSSLGVGRVIGGSGNATRRGGQGGDLTLGIAGIYALNMNRDVVDTFPGTSFRCVFRL